MSVHIGEKIPSAQYAIDWLKDKKITLELSENVALDFFLQTCNTMYDPTTGQDNFIMDLKAVTRPICQYPRELTASKNLKDTRDIYQLMLLQHRLDEIAPIPGDGRVKVAFRTFTADESQGHRTLYLPQNNIGLSSTGDANLYTDGFCGCLAVILTPVQADKKGGILAHIAQNGSRKKLEATEAQRDDKQWMAAAKLEYYIQIIDDIFGRALRDGAHWDRFDVTLLFGDGVDRDIELPNLPDQLRSGLKHGGLIRYFQDMRPFRELSGKFILNSHDKEIYLLKDNEGDIKPYTWDFIDPKETAIEYPVSQLKLTYFVTT